MVPVPLGSDFPWQPQALAKLSRLRTCSYLASIVSILLYGCETRTLHADTER
ncbi:hypothetical protein DPMN_148498 [Dreissena polymorpha]|uniref:Uncharacterized protein n=1 Tax=Dreissena polymorpha TaxID=45954 RepID=A0A9D4FBV2_DREPO|nr:hypothetical protein DPMN_148498 [Dreissena polymorpha]